MDSTGKKGWETPTLTVLGDLATLTALGPNNGGDSGEVTGVL